MRVTIRFASLEDMEQLRGQQEGTAAAVGQIDAILALAQGVKP
jgi:hypothetical protein